MAPISEFDYRKIKLFEPKFLHFLFRSAKLIKQNDGGHKRLLHLTVFFHNFQFSFVPIKYKEISINLHAIFMQISCNNFGIQPLLLKNLKRKLNKILRLPILICNGINCYYDLVPNSLINVTI